MTAWQIGETWLFIVVCTVAWSQGGRPERLATGLLLLDQLISMSVTFDWRIEHSYPVAVVKACVLLVFFGWLGARVNRWWPIAMIAVHSLILATYALGLADPNLSHFAAASARVGLLYLLDLTLLFGVLERWLAGEPPASPAAWRKAARRAGSQRDPGARPPDQPAGTCTT